MNPQLSKNIQVKRAYDPPAPSDGLRVLVDRFWPRGLNKQTAKVDDWMKEIAPSEGLQQWLENQPVTWMEFERHYHGELEKRKELTDRLLSKAEAGMVTLLFGTNQTRFNNATALRNFLLSGPKNQRSAPKP